MPLAQAVHDRDRIEYFRGMTAALLAAATEDNVPIKAYFPWSASFYFIFLLFFFLASILTHL